MFSAESNINEIISYLVEFKGRVNNSQIIMGFAKEPIKETSRFSFANAIMPDGTPMPASKKLPTMRKSGDLEKNTQLDSNYEIKGFELWAYTSQMSKPDKSGNTYLYGPVHQFGKTLNNLFGKGISHTFDVRAFMGMSKENFERWANTTMEYVIG